MSVMIGVAPNELHVMPHCPSSNASIRVSVTTAAFEAAYMASPANAMGATIVVKLMMRQRNGRIINFTTIVAPIALAGEAIYAASKAAVVTLTRILAFELGQWGITCNSFGATPIMTDMIRGVPQAKIDQVVNGLAIKRLGTYEDCANVCDFFVRPESDNITGQVLYLGGIS